MNEKQAMRTLVRQRQSWVFILCALVMAVALATENAAAKFDLVNQSDKKSDKKDKDKEKKKAKSDDDDDDDDDDKKKEKVRREEKLTAAKVEAKSETKVSHNAAPSVSLTTSVMEAVTATVETEPMPDSGDAADDPAIWINPQDPALSTIIGTNKRGGLAVYDLSGKQLQYLADGLMDNVDLRDGFKLSAQPVTIVTAGNRRDNSLAIYKVNAQTRQLENVAARKITHGVQVYGSCMYRSPKTSKIYYFATSKSGDVEQWELFDSNGKVDAKKVRNFKVGTVVEGCVADDELGHFYVSEEAIGIWKYGAEPETGATRTQVDKVGAGHLVADVEGLTIAYGKDGKGYLMASSQGNHSFVVYRREGTNEFVKKFRVGAGAIDGTEETDGIDVTTVSLGPAFPQGVFVAHDGFNDKGNQNFKLVPLQAIIK